MSRRRPRGLRPEEAELWQRVAETALPLHPRGVTALPQPRAKPEKPDIAAIAQPSDRLPAFKIGQHAPPARPAHDLSPGIGERLASAPLNMDRKAFLRMSRGKLKPEARIDLHGMTVSEAHPELLRFILSARDKGYRLVLVITGKGRRGEDDGPIPRHPGVLKRQVPQWLSMPPLGAVVQQVAEAHLKHGGSGAYYVYLRRAT
ncbi:Smr/MutS family protein [Halodurantibacterium flavum]|uniref:Smr/MutS family protein n=1 Tax=Halodurantibacterium flavum TaxID=1382802 RepID=A0ABW4S7S7_9RHOB